MIQFLFLKNKMKMKIKIKIKINKGAVGPLVFLYIIVVCVCLSVCLSVCLYVLSIELYMSMKILYDRSNHLMKIIQSDGSMWSIRLGWFDRGKF